MPHLKDLDRAVDPAEEWFVLAASGQGASSALASSPWSMPAFLVGSIGLGVLLAAGHDRRLTIALGVVSAR